MNLFIKILSIKKRIPRYLIEYILASGRDQKRFSHALIYFFKDPWRFHTPSEIFRFEQTNKVIEREFGHLDSILELGCGEGHQSQHLVRLCNKLTSVDISRIALKRARKRVPNAKFCVMNLEKAVGKFTDLDSNTLVIAAEVLYYIKDKESIIEQMQGNYKQAVITFYKPVASQLEPILLANNWLGPEEIKYNRSHFYVYWYKNKNNMK